MSPLDLNVPVNVDDAAFRNFLKTFTEYKSGVDDSVEQWGLVVSATGEAAASATVWREALDAGGDALAHAASLGSKFHLSAERAATAFGKVQSATKGAASHIKEATAALLKWSGVISLVGGGVGLVGMDVLGSHVSGLRTGALRAGTSLGGAEAFKINFARFGDAEGVLGRVSNIKNSADHTALRNLGITDAEINSMDPADLAALAYRKLQERAKGQNPNFLGDWLSGNRINEVFDLGQALQARSTSADEMEDVQSHYHRDRPRLEMTPQAHISGIGPANAPAGGVRDRGLALMDRLVKEHDWTPEAAAIAAGNAQQESGVRSDGRPGDHGTAHGMFQWRKERFAALKSFAAAHGKPWTDFNTQADFFAKEAASRPGTRGWAQVRSMSEAGRLGWDYERYGDNSTGTRVRNAHGFQQAYRTRVVISKPPGGDIAASANAAARQTP